MEIVNNHPSTPNQMKLAVAAYAKAFGLFRKQKWYWMLLVPILLNVVLFYWGIAQVNVLTETTFNFIESLTADWYSAEMGSGIFNEFIRISGTFAGVKPNRTKFETPNVERIGPQSSV